MPRFKSVTYCLNCITNTCIQAWTNITKTLKKPAEKNLKNLNNDRCLKKAYIWKFSGHDMQKQQWFFTNSPINGAPKDLYNTYLPINDFSLFLLTSTYFTVGATMLPYFNHCSQVLVYIIPNKLAISI